MSDENFISRWSRKKREAGGGRQEAGEETREAQGARHEAREVASAMPATQQPAVPQPLPPVESLTPESDFSLFMREDVDPDTRRLAVKKLFEDPRYNVMDGLDVYIDDYSKPDPLPEGWLEKLNQVARLGVFQPATPPVEDAEAAGEGAESGALPAPKEADAPPAPAVTSTEEVEVSQVGQSPPGTV